jgi:hypothetical protein
MLLVHQTPRSPCGTACLQQFTGIDIGPLTKAFLATSILKPFLVGMVLWAGFLAAEPNLNMNRLSCNVSKFGFVSNLIRFSAGIELRLKHFLRQAFSSRSISRSRFSKLANSFAGSA